MADRVPSDAREKAILDHVAIGTGVLTDGWQLFGGLLGGTWTYGGDSPGFWWGQVQFAAGPKVELITPAGGREPDSGFLKRFLDARGAGPHHLNFIVPHIEETLARVSALGIEPVQVSLQSPAWKEAFLHPRDVYGIVIQVAEQSGPPPDLAPPAGFPVPGQPSRFALVEHHVDDIEGATRLFAAALEGEIVGGHDRRASSVELTWRNGARLRLVRGPAVDATVRPDSGVGLGSLFFTRPGSPFDAGELSAAAELSKRLGITLQLGG